MNAILANAVAREVQYGVVQTDAGMGCRARETARGAVNDAYCYCDPEGRLVDFNEAMAAMYAPVADLIRPGALFSDLLDAAIAHNIWETGDIDPVRLKRKILDRSHGPASRCRSLSRTAGTSSIAKSTSTGPARSSFAPM